MFVCRAVGSLVDGMWLLFFNTILATAKEPIIRAPAGVFTGLYVSFSEKL